MSWYCIRTATRREWDALASLTELGLSSYMPCETREVRHARATEPKRYPLLPGYVFADLTPSDVSRVLDAHGVHNILGAPKDHGDRGQPVPLKFLVWLAAHEQMGAFNKIGWAPEPIFSIGRRVRVAKGKLSGALGTITEARGDKRMIVALEFFGRIKPTNLPVAELEAA